MPIYEYPKKYPCMSFLRSYIHCTSNSFLHISTCARGRKHKWAIHFFTTVHSNTVFHSVNESVFERIERASDSTVHSDGLTCFVSNKSAVLNESFDMNDSVSNLLKQVLAATYWRFYCHIYLSMTDLDQPRFQPKNTCVKILFNYQYWPKFLNFRLRKKKLK